MTKKILLSLALAVAGMSVSAQDNPNRMLVVNEGGSFSSFNIGNVEKVKFATVEGAVACDVKIISFTDNSVTLDATRTPACVYYKLNLFPGVIARSFVKNPEQTKSYLDYYNSPSYNEDFVGGNLSGVELEPGTEYAVVTQGYDEYGTACEPRAAYFTTPAANIVGNPKVTAEVLDYTKTTISLRFTANKDVSSYSFVIFKKGKFDEEYEMFAPMFGFTNPGQMITMWGSPHEGDSVVDYTYDNLDPNTEYEVYIQPLDKNDNYASMTVVPCRTESQGGSGESVVDVKVGDYRLNDWGDEMLPSLFVTYTPNDQTWCYRFNVLLAENYDKDPEAYKSDLQSDPEMDMAYWFFYEPMTTDYQINPSTGYVIIASGKNANGEWGKVTEIRGTTPDKTQGKPAAKVGAGNISTRQFKAASRQEGRVPANAGGVRLTH